MTFRIHAVKRAMLILLAAAFLSLPPFSVAAQAMHPIALIAGGATAGAAPNPAVAGQIVSLNPGFAPAGLTFASWAAVTPGVNILNPSSATGATFIMPDGPVIVVVNWQVTGASTFTVSVTGGGAGANARPNPAAAGQAVTLNAGTPPAGQRFARWTANAPGGVTILNPTSATGAIFVMSGRPVAVTANWEPIVSGDGSDESTAGGCNTGVFGALALILTAAISLLGKWIKQA